MKKGIHTSEFWVSILAIVFLGLAELFGKLDAQASLPLALAAGCYVLARGLAKFGVAAAFAGADDGAKTADTKASAKYVEGSGEPQEQPDLTNNRRTSWTHRIRTRKSIGYARTRFGIAVGHACMALLWVGLFVAGSSLTGCKSAQDITYRATATSQLAVKTALQGWSKWVVQEQDRIAALPADQQAKPTASLKAKMDRIDIALDDYKKAASAVVDGLRTSLAYDTNQSPNSVALAAAATTLTSLIKAFAAP